MQIWPLLRGGGGWGGLHFLSWEKSLNFNDMKTIAFLNNYYLHINLFFFYKYVYIYIHVLYIYINIYLFIQTSLNEGNNHLGTQ